jgi:DNA-binding beta-propeller fold protein YncE
MFATIQKSRTGKSAAALLCLVLFVLAPLSLSAKDKKKKKNEDQTKTAQPAAPPVDLSKLVWPGPPNIGRIRYMTYFAGEKFEAVTDKKKKQSWMDRMAGTRPDQDPGHKVMPFQLLGPEGMAVDAKGQLYVADQRVGAVFIFNTETREATLIRNGVEASFKLVNGVAIDDDGRIFVSDGKLHRIYVFDKDRKVVDQITDGLVDPVGLTIDTVNRLLYVADTQQDQVIVYDADSFKLIRRLGTGGKKHILTDPGDFSGPTGVAVDSDGNVYVTDTMNYRVEVFDADGNFISWFGKHCDGPGCFAHPKGIAVDSDNHIWVADPMLDMLQVYDKQGELLAFVGGHGHGPGQFEALTGVFVDKQNRVFTSEQYPGRVQMFRYVTDEEAAKLKKEKEEQRVKDHAARTQAAAQPAEGTAAPKAEMGEKQ